jgi:site-specific recombinase XerD
MIAQLRPRAQAIYRALPVFGDIMEAFTLWCHRKGYTLGTIQNQLKDIKQLAYFFRRRGISTLDQLTAQHLNAAWRRCHKKQPNLGGTIRQVQRFLTDQHALPIAEPRKSASTLQLDLFAEHLRDVRGLSHNTVLSHTRQLRLFLQYLRFDRTPSVLQKLRIDHIEAFLRHAARTNNRFSLQHVVATVRAFLRLQHARGVIPQPLHLQIDTPRVYRLETLPRAWTWEQVQTLLRSIDRSDAHGWRDFTILYLAAAYGLRSREVVQLTLDDIDWRQATLQIVQTKTRQTLRLPLTDEAGHILQQYLRGGRTSTERRELFLRMRAPAGALKSTALHDILDSRLRQSGLDISLQGTHVLRHTFAVHLLQQGIPMKTIGDTLGHREAESTAIYLRLAVEDLRGVGLPVPEATEAATLLPPGWHAAVPRVRLPLHRHPRLSPSFQSHGAASMQQYLATKRALGRQYVKEARILREWDAFVSQWHPQATTFTGAMFHGWAKGLTHLTPTVHRNHLRIVRNFLLFHSRTHPVTFIPDVATFPHPSSPHSPRLVSETEMARVLATAKRLPSSFRNPLRAETARLAFILLFCCGLRRGELLRLKLAHIDSAQNLLRIEGTKFHKSRLVPLSDSVSRTLQDYLALRRRKRFLSDAGHFLLGSWGHPEPQAVYTATTLCTIWQHLCLSAKVVDERGRPPRLHDLRHSFAVNVLQRWYAQGMDAQARLPHLATYLGHVSPVSTYYYLQLTPQLRDAASQRFHTLCASLFQSGEPK